MFGVSRASHPPGLMMRRKLAQFLARARDMFDDVIHGGDVEMPVREARVTERPAEHVQTAGASRRDWFSRRLRHPSP